MYKRQELLHKLLPGMAEDVVILPHFYTDYGYNCVIGAGSYLNHGAYLMDCGRITKMCIRDRGCIECFHVLVILSVIFIEKYLVC